MDNTPLGRVVSVRMETDPKIIANFDSAQRRIRSEWAMFRARQKKESGVGAARLKELQNALAAMFGNKGGLHG